MRLAIPSGMTPAAEVDRQAQQWRCRNCAGRQAPIVLITDATHPCFTCGTTITRPLQTAEAVIAR